MKPTTRTARRFGSRTGRFTDSWDAVAVGNSSATHPARPRLSDVTDSQILPLRDNGDATEAQVEWKLLYGVVA